MGSLSSVSTYSRHLFLLVSDVVLFSAQVSNAFAEVYSMSISRVRCTRRTDHGLACAFVVVRLIMVPAMYRLCPFYSSSISNPPVTSTIEEQEHLNPSNVAELGSLLLLNKNRHSPGVSRVKPFGARVGPNLI